jgi:hypothetical protein
VRTQPEAPGGPSEVVGSLSEVAPEAEVAKELGPSSGEIVLSRGSRLLCSLGLV